MAPPCCCLTKPINADLLIQTVAEALADLDTIVSQTQPPTPTGSAGGATLVSSLPADDPESLEIVEEFVARLGEQFDAMQRASAAGDLAELAELAHWLKSSGGTAGFAAFTEPATRLEQLAKQGQFDEVEETLAEIGELIGRIGVPSA